MSESTENQATQSPKIVLVTALITGIATIAVAFLGIVPSLRGNDRGHIGKLEQQIEQLKQSSVVSSSKSNKTLNISGTVVGPNASPMMSRPDVYLIPLSNPKLMARTKATGEFQFNGVPDQQYWIVVRDPKLGNSGAGFMDMDNREVPLDGAMVKFNVEKGEK